MTFDSLTFARRLKAAGFSEAQAEALADLNRDMVVPDLATKEDVAAVRDDLDAVEKRLEASVDTQGERLRAAMEALGLRLTVRLGVMIAGAVAILGALQRMH